MAKTHFLVEHALENVWAQPTQDHQHVLQIARYSPESGFYRRAAIQRFFVDLPNPSDGAMLWHHVFQIGATAYPFLLSLDSIKNDWVRGDVIATTHGVMINVFLESGVELALCHCWFRRVSDTNVLLAVEIRDNFNLGSQLVVDEMGKQVLQKRRISDEKCYFRCYQNAKAQTGAWAGKTPIDFKPISYVYQYVSGSADFITFLNKVRAAQQLHGQLGKGRYYVDGFLVGTQSAFQAGIHQGHYLIYIHDETVLYEGIVAYPDMGTFVSKQDMGHMKMVLLVAEAIKDLSIHYHDDVDFYVVNHPIVPTITGKGVYFGRVRRDIVRQLTHNAYSLRTASINAIVAEHSADYLEAGKVYIRYIVRDGGMRKGLPFNRERLNDLYKLPLDKIKEALWGVNSVVPEWQAVNLEVSNYNKIVAAMWRDVNVELVAKGYGYHALMNVCFSELIRPEGNLFKLKSGYVASPVRNNLNGSIHVYDRNGLYTGPTNILIDSTNYYASIPNIGTAEFINMLSDDRLDGTFLDQDITSKDLVEYGFRAYVCAWRNGGPLNDYHDVTDSVWYTYTVDKGVGKLVWNYGLLDAAGLYPAVRIQNLVHCYKHRPLGTYTGFLRFSVESVVNVAGVEKKQTQFIPSDSIDLFMNGVPLIENVDYYVRWPEIVIVKRMKGDPANAEIFVRHYGLPLGTSSDHRPPREVGFTKAGILSADDKYDLRNDRNIRITVDGIMKTRNEVKFAEEDTGSISLDGRPYSISEYRFPMNNFVPIPIKPLVIDAEGIDERVTAYITPYINPKIKQRGFIDGDRYQVVSPLISALLHAMRNFNFLNNGELNNITITDKVIERLAAPYWPLLPYEPIFNQADVYYVNILPHQYTNPMEVTERQYVFLELIIHLYLKDCIDLTPYVKIKTVTT